MKNRSDWDVIGLCDCVNGQKMLRGPLKMAMPPGIEPGTCCLEGLITTLFITNRNNFEREKFQLRHSYYGQSPK